MAAETFHIPAEEFYLYIVVFYLKKNRMVRCHAPFSEHHAPFDKKKTWRHVLPMCPFSFLQTIRNIAWSQGDNSSELSNFDAIVKKKNAEKKGHGTAPFYFSLDKTLLYIDRDDFIDTCSEFIFC
jgi:hypothetical protein